MTQHTHACVSSQSTSLILVKYNTLLQSPKILHKPLLISQCCCGFVDSCYGADYDLALWGAYYIFLRPHRHIGYHVLNKVQMLENTDNLLGNGSRSSFLVGRPSNTCRLKAPNVLIICILEISRLLIYDGIDFLYHL